MRKGPSVVETHHLLSHHFCLHWIRNKYELVPVDKAGQIYMQEQGEQLRTPTWLLIPHTVEDPQVQILRVLSAFALDHYTCEASWGVKVSRLCMVSKYI